MKILHITYHYVFPISIVCYLANIPNKKDFYDWMIHIRKIFDSKMGDVIPVWDGLEYYINCKWDIHQYQHGQYDNGNVARNAVYGTACFHIGI